MQRPPRETGATVRDVNRTAVVGSVQQAYTDGTRRLATRYVTRLARTRVSPNALTTGGVLLCIASRSIDIPARQTLKIAENAIFFAVGVHAAPFIRRAADKANLLWVVLAAAVAVRRSRSYSRARAMTSASSSALPRWRPPTSFLTRARRRS